MTVLFVADEGVADSGFYASFRAMSLSESECCLIHEVYFVSLCEIVTLPCITAFCLEEHVVQQSLHAAPGSVCTRTGCVTDGATAQTLQTNTTALTPPTLLSVRTRCSLKRTLPAVLTPFNPFANKLFSQLNL